MAINHQLHVKDDPVTVGAADAPCVPEMAHEEVHLGYLANTILDPEQKDKGG